MLKSMRDSFHHLKWILLAVVAAFIVGFVFIDVGLGGANQRQSHDGTYAARVNGETISRREYDRALSYRMRYYEQMAQGRSLTPEMLAAMGVPKQTLDSL